MSRFYRNPFLASPPQDRAVGFGEPFYLGVTMLAHGPSHHEWGRTVTWESGRQTVEVCRTEPLKPNEFVWPIDSNGHGVAIPCRTIDEVLAGTPEP